MASLNQIVATGTSAGVIMICSDKAFAIHCHPDGSLIRLDSHLHYEK